MNRITVASDAPTAAAQAAGLLRAAIAEREANELACHIATAGGSTPRLTYEALARAEVNWALVHLWPGDERLVPPTAPDSNVAMLYEVFGSIAPDGPIIHPVPTDRALSRAAADYGEMLLVGVPHDQGGHPRLDVAFLGMGEDGHTASLFPSAASLEDPSAVCVAVDDAPKPPPLRVSMSLAVLNRARQRVVLVTGQSKAGAVAAAFETPDVRVPVSLLERDGTTWVVDEAAASALDVDVARL